MGAFVFRDPLAANTSAVTLRVGNTSLVTVGSLGSGEAVAAYDGAVFELVSVSTGQGCGAGGGPCVLQLSAVAPVLDYDVGLRAVVVSVEATGATGLVSWVTVRVDVLGVNEAPFAADAGVPRSVSFPENRCVWRVVWRAVW